MATSRRSLIAVFVIVLTLGAAVFFTATAPERLTDPSAEPSALSERGITSAPPLAPEFRPAEGRAERDGGRRLPAAFGFIGLAGLALGMAAACAHHFPRRRGPVLTLAFAHHGPRAPPRPVTFTF